MKVNPVEQKHQELKSLLLKQQNRQLAKSHSNINKNIQNSPDSGFGTPKQHKKQNLRVTKSEAVKNHKRLGSSSIHLNNYKSVPNRTFDRNKVTNKGSQIDLVTLKPRPTQKCCKIKIK